MTRPYISIAFLGSLIFFSGFLGGFCAKSRRHSFIDDMPPIQTFHLADRVDALSPHPIDFENILVPAGKRILWVRNVKNKLSIQGSNVVGLMFLLTFLFYGTIFCIVGYKIWGRNFFIYSAVTGILTYLGIDMYRKLKR